MGPVLAIFGLTLWIQERLLIASNQWCIKNVVPGLCSPFGTSVSDLRS